VSPPMVFIPAGFSLRFSSYFVDGLIIFIPVVIVGIATSLLELLIRKGSLDSVLSNPFNSFLTNLAMSFVVISYFVFFTNKYGATPGKKKYKIRVVSSDGTNLSLGRIILRESLGRLLSSFLYLGYIMVLFTKNKQALHDLLARTNVVKIDNPETVATQTKQNTVANPSSSPS
jgi:uncharacterized RDD family membrane protein YckC